MSMAALKVGWVGGPLGDRGPDKARDFSVYQAFIGRAKAKGKGKGAMRELRFEGWQEALHGAELSARHKRSWAITVRWYLSFCRRGRRSEGGNLKSEI
jgi:hypothetical protein